MISDDDIKKTANDILMLLAGNVEPGETLPTAVYRGISAYQWPGQHPGACDRHKIIFNTYNAIPRYCFNCLKIAIKPRTVIELIKLMVVFHGLKLPDDNTRKCLVECREQIPGTYTGLIYCTGMDEADNVYAIIKEILANEISDEMPVFIKRGCSEYDVAHPGFANVADGIAVMGYNEEWAEYEAIVDKEYVVDSNVLIDSHNEPAYTLQDAKAVFSWLMYASLIGDSSYLKISGGQELPPLKNIKRPSSE